MINTFLDIVMIRTLRVSFQGTRNQDSLCRGHVVLPQSLNAFSYEIMAYKNTIPQTIALMEAISNFCMYIE